MKLTEQDRFLKASDLLAHLAELEKEIAWNEQRLTNLVWGEADKQQTEDYIADLRQERQRLLEVLGQ